MTINLWMCNILIFFTLVSVCIAIYSFRKRSAVGATTLGILAVGVIFYSFGYAMELVSIDIETMLLFNSLQYIGIPFLSALWLLLAMQVTAKNNSVNIYKTALLFVIPITVCVLRYTSDFHDLYYIDPYVINNGSYYALGFGKGIGYMVGAMYILFCNVTASVLFLRQAAKSRGNRRRQGIIMAFAVIPSLVMSMLSTMDIIPDYLDLAPLGLSVSTIILLIGLSRYYLIEPVRYARKQVFEWSDIAMMVLDTQLNVLDLNPAAKMIFQKYSPKALNHNVSMIDKDGLITEAIKSEEACTLGIQTRNEKYYYHTRSSPLYDKEMQLIGYLVSFSDTTQQVRMMRKISLAASTDSLTGVLVRRSFDEQATKLVEQAFNEKTPVSMLILDIDDFKGINDRYGHLGGDILLKNIAAICQENIRNTDVLGRMGGDEFVILLPNTGKEGAIAIAERIRDKTAKFSLFFEGNLISATMSIGIDSGVPLSLMSALKKLYKNADIAMYKSKDNGRNCIEVMSENL